MDQQTGKKALTLKTLTKSSVWDIQENDIFRLWEGAEKDAEVKDNVRHYVDIIRSAFMIEEINGESAIIKGKYEKQGYKVGQVRLDEDKKITWAIKKKHITAAKLVEVLDRNFGGGWDSLSQSIKDIIESGFDISTTTLPKDRLHKKGGMYEKKVDDGYDVLEVSKGTWVEAIFAKLKPESEKPRMKFASSRDEEDSDEDVEIEDTYNKPDEDDIEFGEPNDDEITEENYSTMMDLGGEDPDEEAANLAEYGDE